MFSMFFAQFAFSSPTFLMFLLHLPLHHERQRHGRLVPRCECERRLRPVVPEEDHLLERTAARRHRCRVLAAIEQPLKQLKSVFNTSNGNSVIDCVGFRDTQDVHESDQRRDLVVRVLVAAKHELFWGRSHERCVLPILEQIPDVAALCHRRADLP